jgi:zinc/manganese transport system substrate-binding protein
MKMRPWLAAMFMVLGACGGSAQDQGPSAAVHSSPPPMDPPAIVVTTNILGDVAGAVAGSVADVTVLMGSGADPHHFSLSAAEAQAVHIADLIVANGLGLEERILDVVREAERNGVPVLWVAEAVDPLWYGHSGDEGLDPHFWTDPHRMLTAVDVIAESVAGLPGIDGIQLEGDADRYRAQLTTLIAEVDQLVGLLDPKARVLVTNHHVFGYFADRYDFDVVGVIIPSGSTLASPSVADLVDLLSVIDQQRVPAIFAESSQPDAVARVLASEAQRDVAVVSLYSESLTELDGEAPTYIDMVRTNVTRIVDALRGD